MHLARRGFSVIARNFRTRFGEIDLVAFDGDVLAFVEVKTRRQQRLDRGCPPLESLGPLQRNRLRRVAAAWLSESGTGGRRPRVIRFDAIGVTVDGRGRLLRLDHLEGAW